MIILQILGVVFLVVLLVLAYFGFRFWRGLKGIIKAADNDFIKLSNVLPPIMLELEPLDSQDWLHPKELGQDNKLLKQHGFEHEGLFQTFLGSVEAHISFWNHPSKYVLAISYEVINDELPESDPIFYREIIVKTQSGAFTLSGNPVEDPLPANSNFPVKRLENADFQQLIKNLKSQIPVGLKPQTYRNGREMYVKAAQEYNRWLWTKPQLQSPEFQKICDQLSIELNDETLNQLLDHARFEQNDLIDEEIIRKISNNPKISAAQWEKIRDRLVIIHEQMSISDLSEKLYELYDYEILEPFEQRIDEWLESKGADNPISSFETLIRSAKLKPPRKITSVSAPVQAQVYLGLP